MIIQEAIHSSTSQELLQSIWADVERLVYRYRGGPPEKLRAIEFLENGEEAF
jgi:hypothetical protein